MMLHSIYIGLLLVSTLLCSVVSYLCFISLYRVKKAKGKLETNLQLALQQVDQGAFDLSEAQKQIEHEIGLRAREKVVYEREKFLLHEKLVQLQKRLLDVEDLLEEDKAARARALLKQALN